MVAPNIQSLTITIATSGTKPPALANCGSNSLSDPRNRGFAAFERTSTPHQCVARMLFGSFGERANEAGREKSQGVLGTSMPASSDVTSNRKIDIAVAIVENGTVFTSCVVQLHRGRSIGAKRLVVRGEPVAENDDVEGLSARQCHARRTGGPAR